MRERCESAFFERLSAAHITISMVAVNGAGCVLAVGEYDLEGMHKAAQSLNVALRVRSHCDRVSVSKRGAAPPLPPVSTDIAAMAEEGIGIILRAPMRFPSSSTSETPSEPKSSLAAAPAQRREAPPSLDAFRRDRALRRPVLRVATSHGVIYGDIVRVSSVLFLIRPRLPPAASPHAVSADEITRITPLPDPR